MPEFLAGETLPAPKLDAMGITAQFVSNVNSSAFTVDTVTDMVLNNVPVIAGDTYALHLHTGTTHSASPSRWDLEARVNGVVVGRFGISEAGDLEDIDGTVYWTAPTTQATDDFDVFGNEQSGAGDLTLNGTATIPRWFTIVNIGAL
jgi:hypothetical protein